MPRFVTVGLDGSAESRAAAEWAAREANLRGLPLKLVHVWEPVPGAMAEAPLLGAETHEHWTGRIPRDAAEGVRRRHPGLEVGTEQLTGGPAEVLAGLTEDTELLALGTRGLGGIGGFMIGSVSLAVVAHARRPVALVRAGEQAADEHETDPAGVPSAAAPFRPVVLGLDTDSPDDTVIAFAFEEAARRATSLHVVHGWSLPSYYAYSLAAGVDLREELSGQQAAALTEVLRPWRQKYPSVEVAEESRFGSAGDLLSDASRNASLVVVGRRFRRNPLGTHIGSVTHAVMHHAVVPVAVVPHD